MRYQQGITYHGWLQNLNMLLMDSLNQNVQQAAGRAHYFFKVQLCIQYRHHNRCGVCLYAAQFVFHVSWTCPWIFWRNSTFFGEPFPGTTVRRSGLLHVPSNGKIMGRGFYTSDPPKNAPFFWGEGGYGWSTVFHDVHVGNIFFFKTWRMVSTKMWFRGQFVQSAHDPPAMRRHVEAIAFNHLDLVPWANCNMLESSVARWSISTWVETCSVVHML